MPATVLLVCSTRERPRHLLTRAFPRGRAQLHVVRDADLRSVAEITRELRAVEAAHATTTAGRLLDTLAPRLGRIPGLYRAMFAAMSRSRRVHLSTGTVQVTAVGMFAGGGGFALAPPTLASLVVVVGGLSRRPWAVADDVELRDILDLTVTVDHNVVDGAVRGTAGVVRDTAGELRKGQTGFVRAYAGFIGIGVVILLAWFVVARAIL